MFEGFQLSRIDTGEAEIRVRHGGHGPGLLLLHGHPQTHVMWHKVAPRLAQDFTVVAADRGKKRIACPMLVLTCLKDDLKDYFDIQSLWREWADRVEFQCLNAGHHAPEELPEETYQALFTFFSAP